MSATIRVVFLIGSLGFVTLLVCSLLLGFSIEMKAVARVLGSVLFVMVVVGSVLARVVKRPTQRVVMAVGAGFAAISGATLWLVPQEYYQRASYANKAVVFFFVVFPVAIFLTMTWPEITRLAIRSVKENANIDESQELILYLATSLASALVLSLVAPITSHVELMGMREAAITNSAGVWFLSAILAAVMGAMIEKRADENSRLQEVSEVATSKPITDYDRIPAAQGPI